MNTTRCPELWPWKRWGDTWGRVQSVLVNKMNEDSEKWGERDRDPEIEGERLSLFPVAAVINYHKFCGQHKWILLHFWTSEVQNGSHWAKIKVSAGLCFFWRLRGKNLFPCFFQLLEATHVSPHGPASLWPSVVTSPFITHLRPSCVDPEDYIGPIWKIQDHLHISKALI